MLTRLLYIDEYIQLTYIYISTTSFQLCKDTKRTMMSNLNMKYKYSKGGHKRVNPTKFVSEGGNPRRRK